MPTFIARIELNRVGDGDTRELYASLHGHMAAQGFIRTVVGLDGNSQLPSGTYVSVSNLTTTEMRDKAVYATIQTGHTGEIFVCRAEDWASSGLDAV